MMSSRAWIILFAIVHGAKGSAEPCPPTGGGSSSCPSMPNSVPDDEVVLVQKQLSVKARTGTRWLDDPENGRRESSSIQIHRISNSHRGRGESTDSLRDRMRDLNAEHRFSDAFDNDGGASRISSQSSLGSLRDLFGDNFSDVGTPRSPENNFDTEEPEYDWNRGFEHARQGITSTSSTDSLPGMLPTLHQHVRPPLGRNSDSWRLPSSIRQWGDELNRRQENGSFSNDSMPPEMPPVQHGIYQSNEEDWTPLQGGMELGYVESKFSRCYRVARSNLVLEWEKAHPYETDGRVGETYQQYGQRALKSSYKPFHFKKFIAYDCCKQACTEVNEVVYPSQRREKFGDGCLSDCLEQAKTKENQARLEMEYNEN